ncbi:MAG TPA: helix-turn-helix transcriptional regulator [Longimicrobium sp.]|nr:helix-turn-helix transcriptional regulator [Longimicrobium sp.]
MSLRKSAVSARDLFDQIRRENQAVSDAEQKLGSRLTLARNVLRMRNQRGWTQGQLAKALGVTQPRIAEIEAGQVSVRTDTIDRLAAAFNVEPSSLLRRREADEPDPGEALAAGVAKAPAG